MIMTNKGNTLNSSLQALYSYMTVATDYTFLGQSLLEKILSCAFDSNLNTCKASLQIINLFTRADSPSHGAKIFITKKKESLPVETLVKLVESSDVAVGTEALHFINNLLMNICTKDSPTDEIFEKKITGLGLENILLVRKTHIF